MVPALESLWLFGGLSRCLVERGRRVGRSRKRGHDRASDRQYEALCAGSETAAIAGGSARRALCGRRGTGARLCGERGPDGGEICAGWNREDWRREVIQNWRLVPVPGRV